MRKVFKSKYIDFADEYYKYIYFEPTYRCNYKCEYCVQKDYRNKLNNSVELNAPDDVVDGFIKFVNSLEQKSFFQLLGGEIFIHPRIYEILDVILKNGHDLEIITNFSFPLENYKKMLEMNVRNSKILISISLHLSQVNIDDFKQKVVELADLLKENDYVKYSVRSVLLEENFDTLVDLDKELFEKTNQNVEFQNLLVDKKEVIYSEKFEKYMQNRYLDGVAYEKKYNPKYKHTFGKKCYAGKSWICIFNEGQIKRCFNEQYGLMDLGNIREGEVDFYKKPMPCVSDCCNCSVFLRFGLTDYDSKTNFVTNLFYKLKYIELYKWGILLAQVATKFKRKMQDEIIPFWYFEFKKLKRRFRYCLVLLKRIILFQKLKG